MYAYRLTIDECATKLDHLLNHFKAMLLKNRNNDRQTFINKNEQT